VGGLSVGDFSRLDCIAWIARCKRAKRIPTGLRIATLKRAANLYWALLDSQARA